MDIKFLQSVQRIMTKMITGMGNIIYENRLKQLNLHSLGRLRVRRDLIELFKWLREIYKGDIDKILMESKQDKTRSYVDLIKK